MAYIPYTGAYEKWAPIVARILLAVQFGLAAWSKVMAFGLQARQVGMVGMPFPQAAVALALLLEVAGVIALVAGWQLRTIAMVLAGYVTLLAAVFYHNWSDPVIFGMFVSHLGLIAALLYVSASGTRHPARRE